ncbi:MAG: glycosyltransferase [Lachnospiraceae bacterium]
MRQKGFLNNRVLEGLCCGRPVLSDYCEEYEELLGDSVVFYRDEQDFLEKLKLLEQSDFYTQQMEKVQAAWPLLQQKYSFEARTRQLVELAKQ